MVWCVFFSPLLTLLRVDEWRVEVVVVVMGIIFFPSILLLIQRYTALLRV